MGVIGAAAIAATVLVVAWSLDRDDRADDRPRFDPEIVTDLVAPDPLSDRERASLGGENRGSVELSSPAGVSLAEGGWIEVADDSGRLKQRYAAARMDPLPDGWVEMVEPRALVFGRRGQVTALEGGFGTARLPEREIESGTLREDVRIRFFRPEGDGSVSVETDEPWLVIEAESADFDGAEGRIRCDGPVSIASPELEFAGVNLLVLLQPDGREIEQLVVERATAPLRLRPQSRRAAASERGRGTSERRDEQAVDGDAMGTPGPAAPERGGTPDSASGETPAAAGGTPPAPPAVEVPAFMRLVLDGGVAVVRTEGDRRLSITGDRLAAVFAMEGDGLGSIATTVPAPAPPAPPASSPVPAPAWLAAAAMAVPNQSGEAPREESGTEVAEIVEIEFGGSLLIEPIEPGVPTPASAEEVWVRVDGRDVRLHEEIRDARIRCDLLDLRTGGPEGDRVDLLAGQGLVEIDAPGLSMQAPAVRLRGSRVLVAGPGRMQLEPTPDPEPETGPESDSETDSEAGRNVGDASRLVSTRRDESPVEIAWADRLDLTLGPEQERLQRARFEGGPSGRVRVRSETLALEAGSLDVAFLAARDVELEGDRIDRIDAQGEVVAGSPDGASRLEAAELVVEMRQDPDAARPGRVEATGDVRAFDAERVIWASSLEAVMRSPEDGAGALPEGADDPFRDDFESVEARGGVVAGLADGTWVFTDRFEARPGEGRLTLEGEDVALLRDGALLDGLQGLRLVEGDGRVEARTGGPGRLQAARAGLLEPWIAPSGENAASWSWPPPPTRPAVPEDLAVAAVWEGGLRYLESRDDSLPGAEVATLEVSDRVRARAIDEAGTEDRLAGDRLRVGFTRSTPTDPEGESSDGEVSDGEDPDGAVPEEALPEEDPPAALQADPSLEIASMDLDGGASLERRRWAPDAEGATRPDLLRISGERVAYVVATGEGRVPGAGTLLVSEAATAIRQARTARFRWAERLDLIRRGESESAVAISGEVELAFAGGSDGPAFTLTADRMDATLQPPSPGEASDEKAAAAAEAGELGDLGNLELRTVAGAGRVFVRGQGRDVECDAFDYDAETGMLLLTARPGRSVSVMSTTAAAPIRAERVRWNLRTDRVEVESARGEG